MLDVARIIGATRGIAKHHRVLRQQQLDIFGRTSSLVKISRTRGPQFSEGNRKVEETGSDSLRESFISTDGLEKQPSLDKSTIPDTDVFYDRSGSHAIKDSVTRSPLNVQQATTTEDAILDGTRPLFNSPAAGETDREGAFILPHEASLADHLNNAEQDVEPAISSLATAIPGSVIQQDKDNYRTNSTSETPASSSSLCVKLPENPASAQASVQQVPNEDIDRDVFYSSKMSSTVSTKPAAVKDELGEEVYAQLFHSRNVAEKLTGQPIPYGLGKGNLQQQQQNISTHNRHPLDTRPILQDKKDRYVIEDVIEPAVSDSGQPDASY